MLIQHHSDQLQLHSDQLHDIKLSIDNIQFAMTAGQPSAVTFTPSLELMMEMLRKRDMDMVQSMQHHFTENFLRSVIQPPAALEAETAASRLLEARPEGSRLCSACDSINEPAQVRYTDSVCELMFVADLADQSARFDDVSDEADNPSDNLSASEYRWIINRADPLGNGDATKICVSWWSSGESIRRFELRSTCHSLSSFLPDFERVSSTFRYTYTDYYGALVNLMDVLGPNILGHAASRECLVLQLGGPDQPLLVRGITDTSSSLVYPPVSEFSALHLRTYREQEFTSLRGLAGWVYRVSIGEQSFVRKDIVDRSQLDSFKFEVSTLADLQYCQNVVKLFGLVVSNDGQRVRGMLVESLTPGFCIGNLTPGKNQLRAAEQILQILVDVHATGIALGEVVAAQFGLTEDFVVKLVGVKRRGCPLSSQPPETTTNHAMDAGNAFHEGIFDKAPMRLSIKSDIWQLGRLFLDLFLGCDVARSFLEAETPTQQHLADWLTEMRNPSWLASLIMSCLEREPQARPFAKELLQTFREQRRVNETLFRSRVGTHRDFLLACERGVSVA